MKALNIYILGVVLSSCIEQKEYPRYSFTHDSIAFCYEFIEDRGDGYGVHYYWPCDSADWKTTFKRPIDNQAQAQAVINNLDSLEDWQSEIISKMADSLESISELKKLRK